jgi:hypothetical protein
LLIINTCVCNMLDLLKIIIFWKKDFGINSFFETKICWSINRRSKTEFINIVILKILEKKGVKVCKCPSNSNNMFITFQNFGIGQWPTIYQNSTLIFDSLFIMNILVIEFFKVWKNRHIPKIRISFYWIKILIPN